MTNLTTRPSDEVTAKVVAKLKGWKQGTNAMACRHWLIYRGEDSTTRYLPVDDPRTDTDAALELERWLLAEHIEGASLVPQMGGTYFLDADNPEFQQFIPASGAARRNAVVNLAARVMEVEDD